MLNAYCHFLLAVTFYYVTDILWGILDEYKLIFALKIDTSFYFAAMALSIFMWSRFVVVYLNEKTRFGTVIKVAGLAFVIFELALVVVNFFTPVMFAFDSDGNYVTGSMRHVTLITQIVMFLLSSVYTLLFGIKRPEKRMRYYTVGFFGLELTFFICIQVFYPLMPLYAIGCLLGTSLIHTFVIEEERSDYLRTISAQKTALGSAHKLAYTDSLTGVRSKQAFAEESDFIQDLISKGKSPDFAVVFFDVNDLKKVNDANGHEAGDRYLIGAKNIICGVFRNSPVFRVGGDEFVVILTGDDYVRRGELMDAVNASAAENLIEGRVAISGGIAEFDSRFDD
ncbi:MAG: GGDEF domain-containing protein, partial [Clostridia bacterium]|nr:GGDEF domain-containing protein [Clostridia bacterium]